MPSLKELISITEKLNSLLDQVKKSNRLELIEEVNILLNERGVILRGLDFSTLKTDPLVNQLLSDEKDIKHKMQRIFTDIKNDVRLINKKRNSGENYINPYQSLQVDGVFFDRKK
ncbi:hypothetical protein [Neobacillus terrae]|uniref:hypothetical protein n=1 Tax=Neobacillus terrae TaxID=3034837 RepID=UPI001409215F|nr:hypothetical protein [Neobacillus terrae]NHM29955.1 hypothetical protein [Neobacillus terrae]